MSKSTALRLIQISCLLLILPLGGFAQTERDEEATETIAYNENRTRYILAGLEVDGISGFDQNLLISLSGLNVGQTYDIPGDAISEAVRRYWQQGLFSNVRIEADSFIGSKAYLHIYLTAQPRISAINYSGVKKSEREHLEERLGLVVGNQLTPNMVDRTEIIIKRYFEERGFKNATVNLVQREDVAATNSVIVDIDIDKNEKIKIHQIYISGIDEKRVPKLKRAMKKTKEKSFRNWFSSKKFVPERYEEDKDYLIDRLNAWGYRDALFVADSIAEVDERHIDLYIDLYQGQQYFIRNIEWVGNTVYSTEYLSNLLNMQKGDVYNQEHMNKRLMEDEDGIGNQYWNTGYVFYSLDPVEVNVVGDSVDLEMRISEGRQATLGRVSITGNDRVYENVIRRELHTKPGDLFSRESLVRSITQLSNMNQFDSEKLATDVDVRPDPYSGTVDVSYPLTTKGGDQIELSAGWGQTGIVGKIGFTFTNFSMKNLFRKGKKKGGLIPQGDGQTLSISGQTNGTYYQSYMLSFYEPWLGGKRPNQLSFSIYFSKQTDVSDSYYNSSYYNSYYNYLYSTGSSSSYYNYANYYDPDKYVKLFGLSLGFGKRLTWPDNYFSFMAELSYTRYMLKSWDYFLITDGNCNNINLTLTLSRSSIDNSFFPRRGSEFVFSVSATPPYSLWDGKDYENLATNTSSSTYQEEAQEKYRWIEYHKWKFAFKNYTALTSGRKCFVLMTRAEFGILGSYNKHKPSPFETYYVGGDGTSGYSSSYATETIALRGYDNGSLAGSNSSNAYAYSRMTLELRYPLMLETSTSVYALAFLEGGNAWTNVSDFNPFDMKKSVGAGVRILLPMVGLLGIDWAWGFQRNIHGYDVGGSQFHFIIGQEF